MESRTLVNHPKKVVCRIITLNTLPLGSIVAASKELGLRGASKRRRIDDAAGVACLMQDEDTTASYMTCIAVRSKSLATVVYMVACVLGCLIQGLVSHFGVQYRKVPSVFLEALWPKLRGVR
jgi:hypothetical protein